MDKSTLSNYGWIVIAVLVLAVMIALATPFGTYIKTGVENTTQGLFDTSEKALNVVGMTAGDGSFAGNSSSSVPKTNGSITFNKYLIAPGCHTVDTIEMSHDAGCYVNEEKTLTWDEFKLAENGAKYDYNASYVTNTTISDSLQLSANAIPVTNIVFPEGFEEIYTNAFNGCNNLTSVTIPNSVKQIHTAAFGNCDNLKSITFAGTTEQWNSITGGGDNWCTGAYHPEITIYCNDGVLTIPEYMV